MRSGRCRRDLPITTIGRPVIAGGGNNDAIDLRERNRAVETLESVEIGDAPGSRASRV